MDSRGKEFGPQAVTSPGRYDPGWMVPLVIILSAFGPLLVQSIGLRMDQLVTYGLFPFAIGYLCIGRKSLISQTPALLIFFIFLFITAWITVITLGGVPDHVVGSFRTTTDEIAGFENYIQIVIIIFVLGSFLRYRNSVDANSLLNKIGKILIVLMAINSVIALASIFTDTLSFTRYFVPGNLGSGDTPFELSSTNGRMTGIFDVPSTAGLAYSLALLMWSFLVRKMEKITLMQFILGGLVIVGGAVTISKTFLFGGLPLFFIYWFLPGRVSSRISFKMLIFLAAIIGAIIIFIDSWVGFDKLADLFESEGKYTPVSLFLHFIQIRYGIGDDLEVSGAFPYIWDVAPIQGLGFAYWGVVDSAYLQYFMEGGLVSVLLYVGFIAFIVFLGAMEWFHGNETGRLLTMLGLFVLLAGVGTPVIAASRVNVIFWVILMLILAKRAARRRQEIRQNGAKPYAEDEGRALAY